MNANTESEESSSETDFSEDERRKIVKLRWPWESNNPLSFPKQFHPKRSDGIKNCNPDFEFFTDEELYDFFCENKTKISTIEEPLMFLRHLKDNRLITDELYQKLENSNDDNDMYDALEYIEKQGKKKVRKFWKCVDQEHILLRYLQLSEITTTLKNSLESDLSKKTRQRSEDRDTGREREVKKRKTEGNSVSNQAGPSSQSTTSQRKKFEHVKKGSLKNALKSELSKKTQKQSKDGGTGKEIEVKKKRTEGSSRAGSSSQNTKSQMKTSEHMGREEEKDLWDMPKHKKWLPVTCGGKEARLDREALRRYKENRKCIKYRKEMITPYQFEEMAGKGTCKKWKLSIVCQGKPINDLLKMQAFQEVDQESAFSLISVKVGGEVLQQLNMVESVHFLLFK